MTDIEVINVDKPVNNIYACCSATKTAYHAHVLVKENFDNNLAITNIEEKYNDRFDDITYYTLGNNTIIGA